ncbi:MAG: ABC-2 transporter permease [Peptoniphilaceae bacterium]|nr:ABC-2 transporter permease [Peptoniphilaceae bacterium]MDY6086102.1 ABC-2 transporter permease [Peptoniphilaceae bacterium]
MISLIQKDFLIAKRMTLSVAMLAVALPLFLTWVGGDIVLPASVVLAMMSILLTMMLMTTIDQEEEKYPKARALLTTVGYRRATHVLHRYVLVTLAFLYCTLVYTVESLVVTTLALPTALDLAFAAFSFFLMASLYLALVTKFGARAGQYIMMAVILAISLGPVILSTFHVKLNLGFVQSFSSGVFTFVLIVAGALGVILSLAISLSIDQKKEL